MCDGQDDTAAPPSAGPSIIGDVVFGSASSPVAVCTLASRSLLAELAGRQEIAVAGRVFTENVGVERMVQNLAMMESVRYMIVCGRETKHRVGRTILSLHANGLDADRRVIGADAPDPSMPNLSDEQLRAFQARVSLVDMIGTVDVEAIVAKAAELQSRCDSAAGGPGGIAERVDLKDTGDAVETIAATRDPNAAWEYDPVGYFLVFVDRDRRLLHVEHRTQAHALHRIFEGASADALCHTIVRHGAVTLLAHAAYLGRELARAEIALALGHHYEQDQPLRAMRPNEAPSTAKNTEDTSGDRSRNRSPS
jgi:tetrahydromethanopterin S-methyltransferase subunit A